MSYIEHNICKSINCIFLILHITAAICGIEIIVFASRHTPYNFLYIVHSTTFEHQIATFHNMILSRGQICPLTND